MKGEKTIYDSKDEINDVELVTKNKSVNSGLKVGSKYEIIYFVKFILTPIYLSSVSF